MIFKIMVILVISFFLGIWTGLRNIRSMARRNTVKIDFWGMNLNTGSRKANFYERATVAIAGLFGLKKEEAIYFTTFRDSKGQPLNSNTRYRLEGKTFDARWWSITTYGNDHYLIPNELNRYSYNNENILFEDDDSYKIQISSDPQTGNWLPSGTKGNFSITIRLYNPAKSVYDNPSQIKVPRIIMEAA